MEEIYRERTGMKKINSVHFGGRWIGAGIIVGIIIPFVLWLFLHRIIWPLVIAGGIILAAFGILFAIEMHQDSGSVPHDVKTRKGPTGYDPETQYPVIRSSICTGEKTAGFKNKTNGHFTEVMLIRSPKDEQEFKEIYHLDSVKTEY